MKNVYIHCEGQTEESFIKSVLQPYFYQVNIFVIPIICSTKRTNKKKYKGGVSRYSKIKDEILMLSKSHKNEFVTSMFDYYAMPEDTPDIYNNEPDLYNRIEQIENAITSDIGQVNCFFGLTIHEFEGLLFSNPSSFSAIADKDTVDELINIRSEFESPEHINNSVETAPSKRLECLINNYAKVKNGTIVSKDIGIDKIMQECEHFKKWIQKIIDC